MSYFSGQGRLLVAERDSATGKPKAFRFVGNVPEFKVALSTDVVEHNESVSGQRLQDLRMVRAVKASVSMTLEDFTLDNLALACYGQKADVAGAAAPAGETLPAALVAGDFVRLKYPKVSAITVTGAADPADYVVDSADFGTLKVVNPANCQGKAVAYTYGAYKNLEMFGATSPERFFRFEGVNTADASKKVLVELYRVALDPVKDLSLLQDDLLRLPLDGAVLYDALNLNGGTLGGFGRIADLA